MDGGPVTPRHHQHGLPGQRELLPAGAGLYDVAIDLSATAADIAGDIRDGRECPAHLEHAQELLGTLSDALSGAASRPRVVCLCGSTRFAEEFRQASLRLTLAGEIVLSIGCDPRREGDLAAMAEAGDPAAVKARLDELHKRKIDLANWVLVINPGGYAGESTRSEIAYATARGKPVRYLEPPRDPA
jgi:hypothetical protein